MINVNEVMKAYRHVMLNLLSAHALTGYNTVSSQPAIGKATVLKKLLSVNGLTKLAVVLAQKKEITDSCLQFTAMMCNYEQETDLSNTMQTFSKERLLECDVLHPNSEVYHHDNLCICTKSSLTCTTFCKCKGSFQCKNPRTVSITEAKSILADDALLV